MNLATTPTIRHLILRLILLGFVASVFACERPDTHLASPPDPDNRTRTDAAMTPPTTVVVTPGESWLGTASDAVYRLYIEDIGSGLRSTLPVGSPEDPWPREVVLPADLSGTYRLTVFLDRADDGIFNDCPFPPGPFDPEAADKQDNIQATTQVLLPAASAIELNFSRRICGPGQPDTGVSGRIDGMDETRPLFLLAEQQNAERTNLTVRTPLPLSPRDDGGVGFTIGELLPGRYHLTIFSDEDGDLTPSSCAGSPGGADRFVHRIQDVEIISGTRRELDPVTYSPDLCEERLTGVSGTISLTDGIFARSDEVSPLDLSVGALKIRMIQLDGDAEPIIRELQPRISGRPLPLPFTVTGIPPGTWSLTAFLDRDDDNAFKACDAVPVGFDAIAGISGDVLVMGEQIADAGNIQLSARSCGSNARSGIRGIVSVDSESGPIGSGRPIRLAVEPTVGSNEAVNVVVFPSHQGLLGAPSSFTQELAPGQYTGQLFLDTDRTGLFNPCGDDGYGDRQVSEPFSIELESGALLALGTLELNSIACPVPDTSITIRLGHPIQLPLSPAPDISVRIDESGGWTMTSQEIPRIDNDEWVIGPIALAPGNFTFTVYTDDDDDGEFSACGSDGGDQYGATFLVELGSLNPSVTMEIPLDPLCP